MADADHLQRAAHACVQASLNVDDDATAAFLLESARRLLERANPGCGCVQPAADLQRSSVVALADAEHGEFVSSAPALRALLSRPAPTERVVLPGSEPGGDSGPAYKLVFRSARFGKAGEGQNL
jgi:hypothetical protein